MTPRFVEAAHLETLIKHLPPSASTLRLLDLTGGAGDALAERRADLSVTVGISAPENSLDAIVAYAAPPGDDQLRQLLVALRPGGRLIILDPDGSPGAAHVRTLEAAGYVRILVEELLPTDAGVGGVLMRGEKSHATADTLERIQSVAQQDASGDFKGRYVHLLVRQTPNKPVWALKPGEIIQWHALALEHADSPQLIAFTSLPNAVAFMQPAVLSGKIRDVNKVAKFSRETFTAEPFAREIAAEKPFRPIINPPVSILENADIIFVPVNPALAESPDE